MPRVRIVCRSPIPPKAEAGAIVINGMPLTIADCDVSLVHADGRVGPFPAVTAIHFSVASDGCAADVQLTLCDAELEFEGHPMLVRSYGSPNAGRRAYEGYATFTGGKTFDGRPMPTWDELTERIRGAWKAAVRAAATMPNVAPEDHDAPIEADVLHDLLGLVLERPPTVDFLAARTDVEREAARDWAAREHLSASDNEDVKRVPIPAWLEPFKHAPRPEDDGKDRDVFGREIEP